MNIIEQYETQIYETTILIINVIIYKKNLPTVRGGQMQASKHITGLYALRPCGAWPAAHFASRNVAYSQNVIQNWESVQEHFVSQLRITGLQTRRLLLRSSLGRATFLRGKGIAGFTLTGPAKTSSTSRALCDMGKSEKRISPRRITSLQTLRRHRGGLGFATFLRRFRVVHPFCKHSRKNVVYKPGVRRNKTQILCKLDAPPSVAGQIQLNIDKIG